jgi:hypothetical protein
MKHLTAFSLLSFVLLAAMATATASTINVTSASQVPVATSDSLAFYISSDNFSDGRGFGYPSEIDIVLGGLPAGGPEASIPGTSGVYMTDMLFTGTLESVNGSFSIPLTDSNASRLGLPGGDMLLTPGSRSGGSYSGPIDLLSAEAAISSQEGAALFASGEVIIDVRNLGAAYTFGYSGSPIASDFSASLWNQNRSQSSGAQAVKVDHIIPANAPEPGTTGLLIIGLTILCTRLGQMHARQRQTAKIRIAPLVTERSE